MVVAGISQWEIDGSAGSERLGAAFRDTPRALRIRWTADKIIVVARVEDPATGDTAR